MSRSRWPGWVVVRSSPPALPTIDHGRLLADHLGAEGVALAGDPHALASTSTATATIDPDGSAHYDFAVEWRLHPVATPTPVPQAVHTCSIAAVLLPGADDVLELLTRLRGSSTITYDVNARPALTGVGSNIVARVERVVAVSDLVKASDEDLDALYPGRDHLEVARGWIALGPAAVVVTRGAAGAVWVGSGPGRRGGRETGDGGRHDRGRGHLRRSPGRRVWVVTGCWARSADPGCGCSIGPSSRSCSPCRGRCRSDGLAARR